MIGTRGGEHRVREAESAVRALYEAHYVGLLRLARVLVDDPGAAEEVVQEAFAGVWQRWDAVEDQRDAIGYLRQSVVNLARSRLRRRRTRRRWQAEHARAVDRTVAPTSVEAAALASDTAARLRTALRALPTRQRECVVLRHLGGCSITETATTLGISEGTVKAHTHRALQALELTLQEAR